MTSAEARDSQVIIKLIEKIKGQGATAGESADLKREIMAARDAQP